MWLNMPPPPSAKVVMLAILPSQRVVLMCIIFKLNFIIEICMYIYDRKHIWYLALSAIWLGTSTIFISVNAIVGI